MCNSDIRLKWLRRRLLSYRGEGSSVKNQFGKLLRLQMEAAGIKENELARALNYDVTYINKWINGKKLPSSRNVEKILATMAEIFVDRAKERAEAEAEGACGQSDGLMPSISELKQECLDMLRTAYLNDSSHAAPQGDNREKLIFTDRHKELINLTWEAVKQAIGRSDEVLSIAATLDIFALYGRELKDLVELLSQTDVRKVKLKLALNPKDLSGDTRFYVTNVLNTIGQLDYIEMSIVVHQPQEPQLLVINDLLCVQLLWSTKGDMAAVFSTEEEMVVRFRKKCSGILNRSDKLLEPAESEDLRRTNVQIDAYSEKRQWLFFNEPPAMLLPEEVMDELIEKAKINDQDYARYLARLKSAFSTRTEKARIDLVFYSSMLNQYISNGKISIGNVSHQLTREQVDSHLKNLSRIAKENPDFHVYMIRDTVVVNEELHKSPSIFIDPHFVYIENSKQQPNANFHISLNPNLRDAFEVFFEYLLKQPYCMRMSPEDLLRYT